MFYGPIFKVKGNGVSEWKFTVEDFLFTKIFLGFLYKS